MKTRRSLHFIGVCGKAMGGIAAALLAEGWRVTGSDEKCYGSIRSDLSERGLRIRTPFSVNNIPEEVDLVIVGKRINADNPELLEAVRRGLPHRSFPQFLREEFLARSRNAVVTGGVGKTTTTAMLTWILQFNSRCPDYLVGGVARNLSAPAKFIGSNFCVLEGDEYASCFDDRNPKFLHYAPEVGVITNIIEDHPDMYSSLGELCDAFAAFVEQLPRAGCLIVPDNDEAAIQVTSHAQCATIKVGFSETATARISGVRTSPESSRFRLAEQEFEIPLCGRMNMRNAAMAALAARQFGIDLADSANALRIFLGVRNRQEEIPIGDCTLVRDKASHPAALIELAGALRQRFPERRLVSIIQPRATGGRDWVYQRDLPQALAHFDKVILTNSHEHNPAISRAWVDAPFCVDLLAINLRRELGDVTFARTRVELQHALDDDLRSDDVVLLTVLEQSDHLVRVVEEALRERGELVAA